MAAETVGLWFSLATGLISIVLATCAILFAALNDNRNRQLNIGFTKTLTIIEEKSTSTQASIDSTIDRIVDEFISLRREATPTVLPPPPQTLSPETEDFLQGGLPTEEIGPFRAFMIKMEQDIGEIRLRQRLQLPITGTRGFDLGHRVHIPEGTEHAPTHLVGLHGTIVSTAMTHRETSGIIYRSYMVTFDTQEGIPTPVREDWIQPEHQ